MKTFRRDLAHITITLPVVLQAPTNSISVIILRAISLLLVGQFFWIRGLRWPLFLRQIPNSLQLIDLYKIQSLVEHLHDSRFVGLQNRRQRAKLFDFLNPSPPLRVEQFVSPNLVRAPLPDKKINTLIFNRHTQEAKFVYPPLSRLTLERSG